MSRLRSTRGCGGIKESIAIPLEKHHGHMECVMPCEAYQKKQVESVYCCKLRLREEAAIAFR
jgi:hypothetical protein